jgi:hypothetical protein
MTDIVEQKALAGEAGDAANKVVSFLGLLSPQEDTPATDKDKGIMLLAVRKDARITLVTTDGEYSPIQVNNVGELRVSDDDAKTTLAAILAAINGMTVAGNLPIVPVNSGQVLSPSSNNMVSGAGASVTLPAAIAGQVLRVTFGGTGSLTIHAPAGVTIHAPGGNSSVAGTITDNILTDAGAANLTLQATSATDWIVVGAVGTWATA